MHSALGVCIKQTWQKRYLVLRDSWTEDGDTSLELYACSDSGKCHTVSLRHVMLVDVYHDSKSFPHAFIVFRSVNLCYQLQMSIQDQYTRQLARHTFQCPPVFYTLTATQDYYSTQNTSTWHVPQLQSIFYCACAETAIFFFRFNI